jgi:hypothetical protein
VSAIFSPCGLYRYRLDRLISDNQSEMIVAFMLHNPSCAGEENNDPTARRGIGFAARWGGGRLIFVNPFAGIATKPKDLWLMNDPIGPDNMRHIATVATDVARSGGFFVFAWGAINPPKALRTRVRQQLWNVEDTVQKYCSDIRCFGRTMHNDPKHPLYLSNDSFLQPWNKK